MNVKIVDKIQTESKEMRTVFAETMDQLAAEDDKVVYLDADIMNSIGMTSFSKKYPHRTVNCGIQEANMVGVACGLSAVGMIPFAHTFGTFASRRVMDQLYISGAYAKLNVKIIGSDPGITAAYNGGTHMAFEDMGMLRCVPQITIIEPVDSIMLDDMIRQTKNLYGVYYIRLSRKKSEQIYEVGSTFDIGKGVTLKDGTDATIFATGICVAEALRAADSLEKEGISARVVNIFTIKPIDKELIIQCAKETGAIVTAENHNYINALGSAVAEVLCENYPVPLRRVGIEDTFGEVGTVDYLKNHFELTADKIMTSTKAAIGMKK